MVTTDYPLTVVANSAINTNTANDHVINCLHKTYSMWLLTHFGSPWIRPRSLYFQI